MAHSNATSASGASKVFAAIRGIGRRLYSAKMGHPLLFFVAGRVVTMFAILFVLGFAIFGLMELAPGDIVDQLITQQILAGAMGGPSGEPRECRLRASSSSRKSR